MSLPEDLRQEYLQGLGIDSYFPRARLPGAPDPVQCEWPDAWRRQAVTAEQGAVPPPPPETRQESIAPSPVVAPEPGSPKKQQARQAEEPAAPKHPAGAPRDEVRFQLLCIRVNDELAILNAMPHMGPSQLTGRHLGLLRGFLVAAGIPNDALQMEEKPFHWPMFQGAGVDNSRPAAAQALTAYLQQKLSEWQFSKLLVMGEQTVTALFGQDGDKDEGVSVVPLDKQAWQTIYTRSLDEVLQRPPLKKELWSVASKLRA